MFDFFRYFFHLSLRGLLVFSLRVRPPQVLPGPSLQEGEKTPRVLFGRTLRTSRRHGAASDLQRDVRRPQADRGGLRTGLPEGPSRDTGSGRTSTDETREIAAKCVSERRAEGFDIRHATRADREGYKAGALAAGLASARGELLAIFDADFVPPPDFLKRTVHRFSDPEVGIVQTRWGHINRDYSLLTRAQAVLLDGHFVVEQTARSANGLFLNFNGTAGVIRKKVRGGIGRVAARHAYRGSRPFIQGADERMEGGLPARGRIRRGASGGHERVQDTAAQVGQGRNPDRGEAASLPARPPGHSAQGEGGKRVFIFLETSATCFCWRL